MDHSLLVTAVKSIIEGDSESSNASIKSTIEGDSESVTAIALSHDDKFLFSASHSRQIIMQGGHQGPIMAMTYHAYGGSELLATAGANGKVNVRDVEGHFCTHSFKGHKGFMIYTHMLSVNCDYNIVFTFSFILDLMIQLYAFGMCCNLRKTSFICDNRCNNRRWGNLVEWWQRSG
ncbi:putative transcription factor WD40-like family [Helianthus anomalus]